uniref:Uncharacterized protein n=1 Tax=Anguilla anguilla TaxID=7936 RepID=A0A0E9PJ01_ANGAN
MGWTTSVKGHRSPHVQESNIPIQVLLTSCISDGR